MAIREVSVRGLVAVGAGALLLGGCGGGEETKTPEMDARNKSVQAAVKKKVIRQTERNLEEETGNYADPEISPTKADCIPESRTKISCVVKAYLNEGFGDEADPSLAGDYERRWTVIVDPDTGRFQTREAN